MSFAHALQLFCVAFTVLCLSAAIVDSYRKHKHWREIRLDSAWMIGFKPCAPVEDRKGARF